MSGAAVRTGTGERVSRTVDIVVTAPRIGPDRGAVERRPGNGGQDDHAAVAVLPAHEHRLRGRPVSSRQRCRVSRPGRQGRLL
jgi:hypothetical protein